MCCLRVNLSSNGCVAAFWSGSTCARSCASGCSAEIIDRVFWTIVFADVDIWSCRTRFVMEQGKLRYRGLSREKLSDGVYGFLGAQGIWGFGCGEMSLHKVWSKIEREMQVRFKKRWRLLYKFAKSFRLFLNLKATHGFKVRPYCRKTIPRCCLPMRVWISLRMCFWAPDVGPIHGRLIRRSVCGFQANETRQCPQMRVLGIQVYFIFEVHGIA